MKTLKLIIGTILVATCAAIPLAARADNVTTDSYATTPWKSPIRVTEKIAADYKAKTKIEATIFSSRPAYGAMIIKSEFRTVVWE